MHLPLCRQLLEGLKVVKRSSHYRGLHPELRAPIPSDAWHDDRWAFFVFDLRKENEEGLGSGSRMAIFALNLQEQELKAVKVITIDTELAKAEVEDLQSESEQLSVPLPAGW